MRRWVVNEIGQRTFLVDPERMLVRMQPPASSFWEDYKWVVD
ncbi:MAG TPA: hypothetical protein VEK32_20835 [Thermodesulfobacteriota bacterium]|nr:hypothetical protein [Thermodesulfobacteriota bacterium]